MGEKKHSGPDLMALAMAPAAPIGPGLKKPPRSQFGSRADDSPTQTLKNKVAREQKIAKIKKALDDRSYNVNSSDVADRLIKHMLQR
jgi:hypothetical protein